MMFLWLQVQTKPFVCWMPKRFDLVLTDLRMAGKSGMRVIERAMQLPNAPVCIMMTPYGSVEPR